MTKERLVAFFMGEKIPMEELAEARPMIQKAAFAAGIEPPRFQSVGNTGAVDVIWQHRGDKEKLLTELSKEKKDEN